MGLKAILESTDSGARLLRLIEFISKTCPIQPSLPIRSVPTTRLLASAMAVTILLTAGLVATMPPPPLGGDVWMIDRDAILPNKDPSTWPPPAGGGAPQNGFWLDGHQTLIIRDCTIYTAGSRVWVNNTLSPPGGLEEPQGGYAIGIYLKGFANLTMINVRVIPSIDISVSDNASLKMVNATNWSIGWMSHRNYYPPEPGVYSMYYKGGVSTRGNARVWVENSRIAGVSKDFYESDGVEITVIDSWFANSRKYAAVKVNATLEKTVFKWGEPISMHFRPENVGEETLNFSDSDGFHIIATEYTEETAEKSVLYEYKPASQEYHFPSTLRPGEAIEQTLTLLGDGSTPFSILISEETKSIRTGTWWNQSLNPGEYWMTGNLRSPSLDFSIECGGGAITITDEKWQG